MSTIKYFIYARKSTDDISRQIQSIESQLIELRRFASQFDLTVVEEFVERQTAKKPGRPVFAEMLDKIHQGEATGILSWNPDRLSRNPIDAAQIIYMLDTEELEDLKFPTVRFDNDSNGKLMLNMLFGQSKHYVDSLSTNVKRGQKFKIEQGWKPGVAPLGYLNDVRTKTIVIDGKVAPHIKTMFEMYASGDYSFDDLGQFMAGKRIRTANNQVIKRDTIRKILTSCFYTGLFKVKGEIYQGAQAPIISQTLFDKVQAVIKARGKERANPKNYPKAYTGLLRCETCGMMVTSTIKRKRYKNGQIGEWNYYHCSKRHPEIKCDEKFVREEILEPQLEKLINQCKIPEDTADYIFEQVAAEIENSAQAQNVILNELHSKISSLDNKISRLTTLYVDAEIERDYFTDQKEILVKEKNKLTQEMKEISKQSVTSSEPVKNFLDQAKTLDKLVIESDKRTKRNALANLAGWNLVIGSFIVRYLKAKDGVLGGEAANCVSSETPLFLGETAGGARGENASPNPWRLLFDYVQNGGKLDRCGLSVPHLPHCSNLLR